MTMEPTNKSTKAIKKLFTEVAKHKDDPTMKALVKTNQEQIKYNLDLYGYTSQEEFGKENSFCIDCGCSLTDDNACRGCGREFGW